MKTKVLVLGANGYVGQAVIRALKASTWAEPVAGVRGTLRLGDVASVKLDATDASALRTALADVGAVVNCVAGSPAVMVAGAEALKKALAPLGASAPRLVHFSSMAVYGGAIGVIEESTPAATGLAGYAGAKAQTETILAGLPNVVMLRPGCIYGPGSPQWSERIALLLADRRIGDLGAAGDGCSNLVYIDDVVEAVLQAVQRADVAGGVFNLAMAQAPSWNDYFIAFARRLGKVPVARIGGRRLKIETKMLGPALKIMEIGAGRLRFDTRRLPPPIPPSLLRLWGQDIRLSSIQAQQRLGLDWTPLETGIGRTADAWRTSPR
ncbi:NAD(P)-dependent oxidoreductase [Pigmentiphaga aceris]|uniref:NAD(P)-dependent oxidoreductase n=1 Tax=Pigmentiphaga aceris TaxID=1940612 RepID=A0A5C0B202_9BURK|nr:NAD(P)-dependent oxidoreductase [Pigmentiphaga aceris]QEI07924.1 NAD(P)-dependent oxidoreductase [Pigmentiphaga aceris]